MRYILVGDSQGVGLTTPLKDQLERRGHELAWSRAETGAPTTRVIPWIEDAPAADVAIVVLGGNDGDFATNAPTQYASRINDLISALRAKVNEIIWIGPAHATSADIQRRHEASRAVQRGVLLGMPGVRWIDSMPLTEDLPTSDSMGAHFALTQRRIWAERIMNELSPRASTTTILGVLAIGFTAAAFGFTLWLGANAR